MSVIGAIESIYCIIQIVFLRCIYYIIYLFCFFLQANSIVVQTPPPVKKTTPSPIKAKQLSDIPPFKPIPPAAERPVVPTMIALNTTRVMSFSPHPSKATPTLVGVAVPAFNKMPSSISRISTTNNDKPVSVIMAVPSKQIAQDKLSSQSFALRTLTNAGNDIAPPVPQQASNSIQSLLAATNLTEAALEEVLLQKHRQMLQQQAAMMMTSTTTTTTTTTPRSPNRLGNIGKVMNAPKEYYPVGYDKNFDDNFASRVELPDTSFYCGDQKHFPGLYADEDLGCMVSFSFKSFHA